MKKKEWILLSIFTISILFIKIRAYNYESGDYFAYVGEWLKYIRNNGGIHALKDTFADYNYPYLIFLALISYIPINSLYLIKTLSIIFDFFLILLGTKFVYKYTKEDKVKNAKKAYICLTILPIIIFNSSVWGQADSIYAFFCLLALYYALKDKIFLSFIFLGIAFSLKLQFIFILPVFVIMLFCDKKIKLYHFLIIPIVNFIMCIPAYIVGGNPLYTYKIYFFQTQEYGLSSKTINIYNFLTRWNSYVIIPGVIITLLMFLLLLIYYLKKKIILDNQAILNLTFLSLGICYFFLPCMHERYSYMLDVFSVIWYFIFIDKKKKYIPIIINICSTSLYLEYLAGLRLRITGHRILTIFLFICLCKIFIHTIRTNKVRLEN